MSNINTTIGKSKAERINKSFWRINRHKADGPTISRFEYDHSNTLLVTSDGKRDLLIENDTQPHRDCAVFLCEISPAIVAELLRGYELARGAGLIDDTSNPVAEEYLSTLGHGFSPPERAEDGRRVMAGLRARLEDEAKAANRKAEVASRH
jgi:hypothetical protein